MQPDRETACFGWLLDKGPIDLLYSHALGEAACKAAAEGNTEVMEFKLRTVRHSVGEDALVHFVHWLIICPCPCQRCLTLSLKLVYSINPYKPYATQHATTRCQAMQCAPSLSASCQLYWL